MTNTTNDTNTNEVLVDRGGDDFAEYGFTKVSPKVCPRCKGEGWVPVRHGTGCGTCYRCGGATVVDRNRARNAEVKAFLAARDAALLRVRWYDRITTDSYYVQPVGDALRALLKVDKAAYRAEIEALAVLPDEAAVKAHLDGRTIPTGQSQP